MFIAPFSIQIHRAGVQKKFAIGDALVPRVDDCTRECLALVADTSISGIRVARELDRLLAERGKPKTIVSGNGTELTSNAILQLADDHKVNWHYIVLGPRCPRSAGRVQVTKDGTGTSAHPASVHMMDHPLCTWTTMGPALHKNWWASWGGLTSKIQAAVNLQGMPVPGSCYIPLGCGAYLARISHDGMSLGR